MRLQDGLVGERQSTFTAWERLTASVNTLVGHVYHLAGERLATLGTVEWLERSGFVTVTAWGRAPTCICLPRIVVIDDTLAALVANVDIPLQGDQLVG